MYSIVLQKDCLSLTVRKMLEDHVLFLNSMNFVPSQMFMPMIWVRCWSKIVLEASWIQDFFWLNLISNCENMIDRLLCCLMSFFLYSWSLWSCLNWHFNLDDKLPKMWWQDFQIAVPSLCSIFFINSASQIIFKDSCGEQTDYIEVSFSWHQIIDESTESVFSSI